MPEELKRVPLYIADKQTSVRVPADVWRKMKYNEIDNSESLNGLMIRLLSEHFTTSDQVEIYTALEAVNANELINKLLTEYFS